MNRNPQQPLKTVLISSGYRVIKLDYSFNQQN